MYFAFFFFVSIVVKIANDYFSWANGHISETITHTHTYRSSSIVAMKTREGDKKVSK